MNLQTKLNTEAPRYHCARCRMPNPPDSNDYHLRTMILAGCSVVMLAPAGMSESVVAVVAACLFGLLLGHALYLRAREGWRILHRYVTINDHLQWLRSHGEVAHETEERLLDSLDAIWKELTPYQRQQAENMAAEVAD